jgi:hypothetical protein
MAQILEWQDGQGGRGARDQFDRVKEPVPPAGKRLDVSRSSGSLSQRVTQPVYSAVQAVVEIDEDALGPQPAPQLLPRHQLAGMLQEDEQDLEGLVPQLDPQTALAQLAGAGIGLVRPNRKVFATVSDGPTCTSRITPL